MTEQELINLFYSESLNSYNWDFYDNVDDYCSECGCEVEFDNYTFTADALYSCGDYELMKLEVITPEGKNLVLIDKY